MVCSLDAQYDAGSAYIKSQLVMADGFAWNGQTYDSLSKVAFAITGTKWNGPRFFGLRNKEDRSAMEAQP
jgi:hypothetical protein